MKNKLSGIENVLIDWKGQPFPGNYRATRNRDGWHYCEVRFGSVKTRKYFPPNEVKFTREVSLIMVDKVGGDGSVPGRKALPPVRQYESQGL